MSHRLNKRLGSILEGSLFEIIVILECHELPIIPLRCFRSQSLITVSHTVSYISRIR